MWMFFIHPDIHSAARLRDDSMKCAASFAVYVYYRREIGFRMAHRSVPHGSKFGALVLKLVTELGKHGYVDGPVIM